MREGSREGDTAGRREVDRGREGGRSRRPHVLDFSQTNI